MKIKSSDKRAPGFFITDNEVLDNYDLSPLAFTLYCWLLRYASGDGTFLSVRAFAKKYKAGKVTIRKAVAELTAGGLICASGDRSSSGAICYDILPVEKNTRVQQEPAPGPAQTQPGSAGDPPPGPAQTPKKTERHNEKELTEERALSLPGSVPLHPFIKEYQNQYSKAFRHLLPKMSVADHQQALTVLRDYGLSDEQAVEYMRAWGAKWRGEDLKFWPVSLQKFDGALLARLDKEKALDQKEDEEIEAAYISLGYTPPSQRKKAV